MNIKPLQALRQLSQMELKEEVRRILDEFEMNWPGYGRELEVEMLPSLPIPQIIWFLKQFEYNRKFRARLLVDDRGRILFSKEGSAKIILTEIIPGNPRSDPALFEAAKLAEPLLYEKIRADLIADRKEAYCKAQAAKKVHNKRR